MRLKGILAGFLVRAAQALEVAVALPLLGKLRGMCPNWKAWKWGNFLMALTASGSRLGVPLLLLFALLLGTAYPAQAATVLCSDFGGVVDGNDPATYAAIESASTFGIDMNCTVKNFPQSIGGFPITNINFQFPWQQSYYIVFDNVYYYGNMACNDPTQSDFWIYWTPGGFTDISPSCQEFMVPVDAVLKKNPPAQTTATIGVPFTYTITAPLLGKLDSTGTFQYVANADDSTITNVVIADDLNASGAALSYVSNTAYLVNPSTGARTSLGPLTLGAGGAWLANHPGVSSDSSKHLVFSYENNHTALDSIPAGSNIEIDLTVVLDNIPSNVNPAGTLFTNTAKMWFDKTINSANIVDLQAHPGTTPPMTIIEPNLVVTKTSSMSNLNVGTQAPYTINVQNTGGSDAWNATITDNIPAGMCTFDSSSTVTAQIFPSDGGTLVADLQNGTDFSVAWGPTASGCQLSLQMLTDAAKIGPTQRLIIDYQAMLDAGTPSGTFTNVAGATRWFSAADSYGGRRQYDRTLTDGTPSVMDFQDAYTITAAVQGYYFLKSVDDLTTGAYPATTAFTGDRLRYTLQIQNFNIPPLNGISITDDLGALNGFTAFVPGSLSLASTNLPAGTYTVDPAGGTNGAGTVTVNGLNLDSNTQYQIQFDVTLAANLTDGTIVRNQASLSGTDSNKVVWSGVSDDPYIKGPSLLSATGDITSITIQAPGALAKNSPTPSTATIGQQFSYLITVPAVPVNMPLYDVKILDNLPANVSFVSAQLVPSGIYLSGTGTAPLVIQDTTTGIDIPAGGHVDIEVTVALQNTITNQSGVSFTNSASYTYNKLSGGGSSTEGTGGADSTPMNVVEPLLTATKTVSYASPAGKQITDPANVNDILQYVVTVTNSGNATAYDADVLDTLPPNVELVSGSATARINGAPDTSFVAKPTPQASGALAWGNLNGDPSLDIPVNGNLVLTYQVRVLSVDGTPINNTLYGAWTSLDGEATGERTGDGCPNITSPNDYCTGPVTATPVPTFDPTTLAKAVVSDTWNNGLSTGTDSILRVGDTVVYSLALTLREGVTQNVVVTDTLPTGLAFDSLVSITPASGSSNFTYKLASEPTPGATGTLTWNLGNISNAGDNDPANNTLVIQYRAKVIKNTLGQTPTTQALTNNATLNYAINGVAATPKTSSATINVWQPMLSVSKSAAPAGGGTVVSPGELITYTVDITNSGAAPAYNTVLTDTLPVGFRQAGVTTTSITLVKAGTVLPLLAPPYDSATGAASWNFDTGAANVYRIPPNETLQVVYQVRADSTLGAGMALLNNALVQHYYSFDSQDVPANSTVTDRQVYGSTSAATVQLTTAAATALSKQALVSTVAIGQPFAYEITIPASSQPTSMYDVRVLDDLSLATTGVTMSYVSAGAHLKSGTQSWTALTNSGTATNLILEDTTTGLDIPAGDQLMVDVTVVLNNDTVNNTVGKQFQNTANYTYDSVDNDKTTVANGAPGASGAVTIVGPDLTLQKSGPGTMRISVPGTFGLNVQNTGTGTAWNTTLTDTLPNVTSPATGGMCGSAPTNVTARIYQSDGTTFVSPPLVSGTDFSVSFTGLTGTPACTLTVAMEPTATTAIAPTNRLIVTYQASLDPGSASGLALTNVAGATQYLSGDPTVIGASGNVHTYTNTLTDGTPGILDYQDAFTVTTESPVLTFTKTVYDVTTGQSGAIARPGDTLRYTLTIQNISTLNAADFSLTDELDRLNSPAMFVPGSLTLLTVPAGADTSLTSATGGSNGTGLVSISNLNIDAQGGANDKLVIEFQAQLVPVITNGTNVLNQAQIGSSTLPTQLSDDPSLGGTTDPTLTTITSAPAFRVLKTVQDITSGTSTVMAGDTLRYTITVNNIGTENAIGVTLRDLVPANTSYVANSTTLNGVAVADPSSGVSALQNGMLINSPANPAAGVMPADASAATANTATITFDVKISTTVVDGTIISNQGFVNGSGAGSGTFPEQPSDNPATPDVPNDPTTVVVGNLPLVYALKTVKVVDNNSDGVVDSGDVLHYTITLTNTGATPATGVVLTDAVPQYTTYVPGTVTLNGIPVADLPSGSPLASGMAVSSSNLTPPLPAAGAGTLSPGGSAVVTFDVQVNADVPSASVPPGTLISNQGSVATAQLPTLLTDADGNSSNGYQPTVVVVGNAQQLSIIKSIVVVGGGAALPGSQLEYTIQVTNIGMVPATNVVLTDAVPQYTTYVPGTVTLNGIPVADLPSGSPLASGMAVSSSNLTPPLPAAGAGTLSPGGSAVVRFDVKINSNVAAGTTVINTASVSWNSPDAPKDASASVNVGAIPGSASLNGLVWHDANFNRTLDGTEQVFSDWAVDLYQNDRLLATVYTGTDGTYHINGLTPNAGTTMQYELRFRAPGASSNTAMLGWGDFPPIYDFTSGMQRISNIIAASGSSLQNLNLPLWPNGAVYNSVGRQPIAGARVTLLNAANGAVLPSQCFDDPVQQNQVTARDGFYKFDLNFSDASCPAGGDYLIEVTPPATGYMPMPSQIIPPASDASTAAFSVPACPGSPDDAVPATIEYCEAVASAVVPPPSVQPRTAGTIYHMHLLLSDENVPGQSQIFNNFIPIDPVLDGAVAITKTSSLINVTRGELVPYTITLTNVFGVPLQDISIVDRFPAGFKYVAGSARLDGKPVETEVTGRELIWKIPDLQVNQKTTVKLLLVVGSGVSEGEYINRALALNTVTGGTVSEEATATLRVIPDPNFDCTDVIGKVFDDRNLNGQQDTGEKGLAGVRVVSARGLIVTTDQHGRFHITCAAVPDEDRGSNFILKLDERSLPTGYRLTTENPRVRRATRGKMLRFNFGATIHRVVRIDIADGVFEPNTSELRLQWTPKVAQLIEELKKAPSVLRLSYLADVEREGLVRKRLDALKKEITSQWDRFDGGYRLAVETEVFWRRGAPLARR